MRVRNDDAGRDGRARRVALWLISILCLLGFGSAPRADTVQLVEFVYELDLVSFRGRSLATFETDETADPHGFVLVGATADGLPVLYPAIGEPLPQGSGTARLAALRFRDYTAGAGADIKTLEPIAALPYSPDLNSAAAITPAFDIAVTEFTGGSIVVEADGVARTLAPGASAAIAVGERTISLEEFADAVLETYRAAGVPDAQMPSRAAVIDEVSLFARGSREVTFHARVIAFNHGPVTLADIDLATALDDARRLSREGPYEAALAPLETLLDVMPRHAEAARLFHQMLDRVEAGATASHMLGRIAYPAEQPDDAVRALWSASHSGFALIARPDDLPGSALIAVPVRDGSFDAYLPAGPYRLTVDVPGFEPSELEITLDGETEIDVPLALRN